MGTTISKAQLLVEMNNEYANWQALLDDIGEANMTQPEVAGGWSIKDIIAHLTGWRRRTVSRFQAIRNHEPDFTPPWPPELQEVDEINAWIYESNRDRPLSEVLSESHEVFQQFVDTVDAFSDDEIQGFQRSEWLGNEPLSGKFVFAHFHEEHETDMRAWLDRVRKRSAIDEQEKGMSEHNKALIRRFYDAWNNGKMDEVVSMIAPNYIDHAMPPEMAVGREGFLKARALGRQALADVHLELEHIFAENDYITAHVIVHATQIGTFKSIPPTGKRFAMETISIMRLENDQLVEHWECNDFSGVMKQLGAQIQPSANR